MQNYLNNKLLTLKKKYIVKLIKINYLKNIQIDEKKI